MKNYISLYFVIMVGSTLFGQTVLTYTASDSVQVNCYASTDWPYETTCVATSVYDDLATFSYPTSIIIHFGSDTNAIVTRHIVYADSLVTFEYYPSGQLKVKNISNRGGSLAWIHNESYHPNGQLRTRWNPSADSLEFLTAYYSNGRRERECWYYALRYFNDLTEWHDNGNVRLEAHYERGPLTQEMKPYRESTRVGEWRYFKPNGDLEKIEVYENGKLKETRTK